MELDFFFFGNEGTIGIDFWCLWAQSRLSSLNCYVFLEYTLVF